MLAINLNHSLKMTHAVAHAEITQVKFQNCDWYMHVILSVKSICVVQKSKSSKKLLDVIEDRTNIK